MIGWYVNAGISLKAGSSLNNVNNITFLDIHRPLGLFNVLMTGGFEADDNGLSYNDAKNNYYGLCETFLGNDINTAYFMPFRDVFTDNEGKYLDEMLYQVPSIDAAFPNCWNSFRKNGSSATIYLHFTSLGKLLYIYYSSYSSNMVVYDVGNNGQLVQNASFSILNWWTMSSYGNGNYARGLGLLKYDSVADINIDNIVSVEMHFGPKKSGGTSRSGIGLTISPVTTINGIRGMTGELFQALLGTKPKEPDIIFEVPPENPYEPGGDSGPGTDPPGTFDDSSDAIPDSSLPTLSAANTGFTRIYNPTLSQVQDLARYLWTDDTLIETIWNKIKQYFENPMDAIIGFNLVPVPVPNGGTKNFALMYIDTGVAMTAAASQFVDRDCGSVKLERYYGSALDQSPYTKVSCFLPYIGTVQLNTDEVMGATLQVKYRVDIVSGSCVAKIFVDGNVLYQYSGHCATNIPISSADFSTYVSAAISVAKLAIGAAVGGGVGATAAVTSEATQQTNQVVTRTSFQMDTSRNPISGSQYVTGTRSVVETTERPTDTSSTQASFDGLAASNVSNTVGQIMASKPHVEHSGSFSGNTGYLGVRRPFLIIERPNMCMPKNYQQFNGFPAMITMKFGDCKGYTRVQQVKLTGVTATNPEQAEILTLLKSGVYF